MGPIEKALRDLWNAAEEKLAYARSSIERKAALKLHEQVETLLWEHVYQHQEADQGCLQTGNVAVAGADTEDEHGNGISHAEIRTQIHAIFAAVRASTITPETAFRKHAHLSSLITSHVRHRTAELSLIFSAYILSANIGRIQVELNIATPPFSVAWPSSSYFAPVNSFIAAQQVAYKQRRAGELEVEFGLLAQKLEAVHAYRIGLEQRIVENVDWMEYYGVGLTFGEQQGSMGWKGKEFQVIMKGQGAAYSRFVITGEGRWLLD